MRTAVAVVALLLFLPAPARALAIEPGVAPFHDAAGHSGSYLFSAVEDGLPAAATLLTGSVAPSDVTVVFRIVLDAGSVELPNFLIQAFDGAGAPVSPVLTGGGVLSTDGRGVSAMAIDTDAEGRTSLGWLFDGSLLGGEYSVVLFASWSGLQTDDLVGALLPTSSPRPPFDRRDFFGGTVVPEPGTALLVAIGLALTRRAR